MSGQMEQLALFDLDGWFDDFNTDEQEPYEDKTARRQAKQPGEILTTDFMYLDLRPEYSNLLGAFWEINSLMLGPYTKLNTGPAPYYGSAGSSLSHILEKNPDPKYNLSKTACIGILRRSIARGKELPPQLKQALMLQAGIYDEMALSVLLSDNGKDSDDGGGCLTPWDVQSRRIYEEDGTWPSLYGGEGGGHGYISEKKETVAFTQNQRDEVRDLNNVAGALQAQPGMKQQTFISQPTAIPVNMQIATRCKKLGENTGFGVGSGGDPAYTLQEAHSHGVFIAESEAPLAAGVVTKGNGDCFLTPETHTSLTSGGGQAGQGYPCVLTAGFCAGAAPSAGGIGYQEECAPTMKAGGSGTNMVPTIICLNDQGGQRMDVYENITGTLRAQMDGHPPLVIAEDMREKNADGVLLFENHGIDSRYTGPHAVVPTVAARWGTGGNNTPLVSSPQAFSFDSAESNSMKSKNPHSGCRKTEVSRTIDTTYPDPSKNQGGIAILQETYCIAGNIIDRETHNGGNGFGYQPDISYTLNTCDKHVVFSRQRSDLFQTNEVVSTQNARQCKDATDLVLDVAGLDCRNSVENGDLCGTLQSKTTGGYSLHNVHPVRTGNLIRRLTPLECERLMGVPDGWTDVGGGSDSSRYKALGNSVSIPCVDFVMRGIAYFLRLCRGKNE